METKIEEKIKVGAVFGGDKKLRPVWFVWSGKKYTADEITFNWQSRRGKAVVQHFAVRSGRDMYELSYDTETLVWTLSAVQPAG